MENKLLHDFYSQVKKHKLFNNFLMFLKNALKEVDEEYIRFAIRNKSKFSVEIGNRIAYTFQPYQRRNTDTISIFLAKSDIKDVEKDAESVHIYEGEKYANVSFNLTAFNLSTETIEKSKKASRDYFQSIKGAHYHEIYKNKSNSLHDFKAYFMNETSPDVDKWLSKKSNQSNNHKILNLIEAYKKKIRKTALSEELYKFELVQKHKGKPTLKNNITEEVKAIEFSNLAWYMAKTIAEEVATAFPNELKNIFRDLFDSSDKLSSRIAEFSSKFRELYTEYAGEEWKNKHYHNEQTISIYLTYHDPEKYTFYQKKYYSNYCQFLGIENEKTKERYEHYLMLIHDLIDNYIVKDSELLALKNEFLNENCYQDPNHLLLAQDILFQMFSDGSEIKELQKESHSIKPPINSFKMPLNQILYGPPGTGKTYKLSSEYFNHFTTKESNITSEQHFVSQAQELSWWQAIAIALLELKTAKVSEIMQNRWVANKIENSNSKNVRATVWGTLQMHTKENNKNVNYKMRQAPLIFEKDENSNWGIDKVEVSNQTPELQEILDSVNNFKPNPDKLIKRFVFTTFHQSFTYEDFIEGIKPVLDEESNEKLEYEIQDGIFKKICKRAEKDLENNYAIFIDEINRGNVASIFGELITLIEKDKRAGEEEALEVTLPYSKQKFSVPNNLYIIGTMNTADRSVEALDSALRRRFSFEEMMPKHELLDDILWNDISIAAVLETINKRIEVLIDRDHTIGHSYFLGLKNKSSPAFEAELRSIFKDKVIPLLQEYFFNEYGKIQLVLGKGFVQLESNQISNFAANDTEIDISDYGDKKLYRILNPTNMKDALKILLNQETEE
jgi:hypothetical protein